MCGIAGIVNLEAREGPDHGLVERMKEALRHRGPDEGGTYFEPGVGLGHRRLSIIDLASGRQPLSNEDGSVVVVYNGEIYNFRELARELEGKGHKFRTHCDTEVIVHAWEEWGSRCVERFRGMFAFALWDRGSETLFLARDRLGIKPLYYTLLSGGEFLFGSELKALLAHPAVPRELDPYAVEEYFAFGYVPDPRTILKNVHKLPPAHRMVCRRGSLRLAPEEYWDVPFREGETLEEEVAQEEFVARLKDAVCARLIAEVPLGAFLSGGVDSSGVVAMMAGLSAEPVKTCSIRFDVPSYDESRYAAMVAERYRTDHHVEAVDPDDFALLDRLAEVYDEPFADSSAIPTYRVCELGRKHVTVALSGDGGDETFAGYRRYRWHCYEEKVRRLLPQSVRGPLFGLLGRLYPKADWAPKVLRAKTTFQALAKDSLDAYFHSVSVVGDDLRARLFSRDFRRELDGYRAVEVLRKHARRCPVGHPLTLVQYLDFKTYLPGDILTKVDRASMAHSLEVRVPILDHPLVEWAAGLPPDLKLRGREGKYLMKRALEPYVPHDVLYREKMGFAVPLATWFRGPLREALHDNLLNKEMMGGILSTSVVKVLLTRHWSLRWNYSSALWAVLTFSRAIDRLQRCYTASLSRV